MDQNTISIKTISSKPENIPLANTDFYNSSNSLFLPVSLLSNLISDMHASEPSSEGVCTATGVKQYGELEKDWLGKTQHYTCEYECEKDDKKTTVWESHSNYTPLSWNDQTPGVYCEGITYKYISLPQAPWSMEDIDKRNSFFAKDSGIPEIEIWNKKLK